MAVETPDPIYAAAEIRRLAEALFQAVGVPPEDAALTADNLVEANLRGVDTHGVTRVLIPYVRRIQKGLMEPVTRVTTVRERPATALLDGGNGIGQVIGARAMGLAIDKAATTGVGWIGVFHSNHFGAAAYYAMRALERDMVGIVATNGPPAVAPWGGRQAMLSTNPLAFAIPAGAEPPVVLDMATTVVSRGRITLFAQRGTEIPTGWALDEEGRPTNNPVAALRGTLQPLGGYKGYGLSLILDMLCGVLTGAGFGVHFGGHLASYEGPPQNVGSLFAAVSVDSFMDAAAFRARVDTALRELKESPRAPDVARIYAPGEMEHEMRAKRLVEGIPLPPEVDRELRGLAEELRVEYPDPIGERGR